MSQPNILHWTKAIVEHAQKGSNLKALNLFYQMHRVGVKPNHVTFASVLSSCAKLALFRHGQSLHALIFKSKIKSDVSVYNALITMYSNCGSLEDAVRVFARIFTRDLVSWNAIIAAHNEFGYRRKAVEHFSQMLRCGLKPDSATFTSVLTSCYMPEMLEEGKQVYTHIIKTCFFELDIPVANALVTMYSKCGDLDRARQVFDKMPERNVVSWTAMIAGYAQNELGHEALNLFCESQHVGIVPNALTFACVLKGCANVGVMKAGKQIHVRVLKAGLESNVYVSSALLDMYAKCGSVEDAGKVFQMMPKRDVVSWTTMIGEYVQYGFEEEALKLFCAMRKANVTPDEFTFSSVISSCGSLSLGKQVHAYAKKIGLERDVTVGNSLVTMYAKCGSIDNALHVFENMLQKNLSSWNSMIVGCAHHGRGKDAIELFEQMQREQVKPNYVTFIAVLHACCHNGLIEEGSYYFDSMSSDHGIRPREDHYACMVDILGRAGRLEEAMDLISSMPFEPSIIVWQPLLAACRNHGRIELGICIGEHMLSLNPQDAATYVLLSNIYAAAGKWDDNARIRKLMKERGVRKDVGCSWIEVNNKVHAFVVDRKLHPQVK